jgi:predicted ATPase
LSIVARNTFLSSLVAETAAAQGDITGALRIASEALEVARRTGHIQYEAELVRLTGELTLRADASAGGEAEHAFLEAIDIARRRQARSHELRAATSLARLWLSRGERERARDVLTPIYGWFTEGLDTPNLREAAALVEELAGRDS